MRHMVQMAAAFFVVILLSFTPVAQTVYSDATNSDQAVDARLDSSLAHIRIQDNIAGKARSDEHEMTTAEAEALLGRLKALEQALRQGDEQRAHSIAVSLKERGIFRSNRIFSLIHQYCQQTQQSQSPMRNGLARLINVFCLVAGTGEGLFYYTLDLLVLASGFIIMLPFALFSSLLIYLGMALYLGFYMPLSHTIPRFMTPLVHFALSNGSLTTIGLKGNQTIPGFHGYDGNMIGFTGISVSVVFDVSLKLRPHYFCLGSALAVLGHNNQLIQQ